MYISPPLGPTMEVRSYLNWYPTRLAAVLLLGLWVSGCGGGNTSSSPGSPEPPPGGSFQPRAFPQDYFFHLPNQDGGAWVPHVIYDATLKELFVSNPDINTVEAYSTVDGHHVGEIDVPGPAGLSLSAGDTQLVIGTITPYVYFADPSALHLTGQLQVPASLLSTSQSETTLMPVMPYAMADGSIFLGMGADPDSSGIAYLSVGHLLRYDPSSGTFASADPGAGEVLGNPALSLDGKHLLVPGESSTAQELFLYSTDSQGYVATSGTIQNPVLYLAANADGSQFACVQEVPAPGTGTFDTQVNFFGPALQSESQYTASRPTSGGAVFSRDGKYLYLYFGLNLTPYLTALNTQDGTVAGYVGLTASLLVPLVQFFDADENYHLFGTASPGGALIFNASQLQTAPPAAMPLFSGLPSANANPNVGPLTGGTQVQFIPAPIGSGSADGISSSMEAYFGVIPAPQDAVGPYASSSNGENFLTATTPTPTGPGPVSVTLADANNNAVFLPDAYTYGPHLLRVEPNVASAQGGSSITIFAYGLGFSASNITVTIGGTPVPPQLIGLNPYASFNYPEQSVTVPAPAGKPGWAAITVTTGNGSDTLPRGIQYLNNEASVAGGPFTFGVYDQVRDRFYLTGNGNNIAVFDPTTQAFLQPLQPSGVSSSAVLQGEALTPDDSKLLIADPADQVVVVYDLTAGTSTTVKVILPSDPPSTISGTPQPMFVATTAQNRAFVSILPCIPDSVREINLTDLSVQTRPDAGSTCATYVPFPQYGASSGDGSTLIFAGSSGEEFGLEPSGPEYVWRYDAASDSFSGPVIFADAPWISAQAAADGDGGVLAAGGGIVDQRLLPLVPLPGGQLHPRLHETGGLLYSDTNSAYAANNGFSVFASDTHNGVLFLTIGLPSANIVSSRLLAIDPPGQKILVATQNGGVSDSYGISYYELSVVPLAVGTVSPSQASAGGSIAIHGSGFVAGTGVKIGGQIATCTETDSETIDCTVPNLPPGPIAMSLSNPDGQTYSFDNAFTLQ